MVKNDFCNQGNYVPPAADVPLGVMLRGFGHQRTSSRSYFFDGMKRGSQELTFWQYTISGCGMVEFDGRKFPVRPGEAFLLTSPEKHLYYLPDEPGEWEFLYLTLDGAETMRLARDLRRILPPVSTAYCSDQTVKLAWELISKGMENSFFSPQETSELTYRFMMALTAGCSRSGEISGNDLVMKVHQFCLKHIAENISVEDLAAFTGYSRSHFCRIFRELAGKAPHEYLLEVRIRMSIRMLQNSNALIKEISAACGFADTGYFCKVFRRFTGSPPGTFRRAN